MVVFLFNTIIYVFVLLGLGILIVQLPWLRFFRAFSSVVRQMPGYNLQRRGTARTLTYLCCSVYCLFLCCSMCCFLCRSVLFVCKCVPYNCHRVSTQLQLTNISTKAKARLVAVLKSERRFSWVGYVYIHNLHTHTRARAHTHTHTQRTYIFVNVMSLIPWIFVYSVYCPTNALNKIQ
jgi:hypothetical protein